jgi:hypothetical protein
MITIDFNNFQVLEKQLHLFPSAVPGHVSSKAIVPAFLK